MLRVPIPRIQVNYLYLGRRCVTRQQCERMRDLDQATVLRQREQRRNASGHAPAPAGALGAGDAAAAVADALLAGADDADNPRYWTFNG
ncbi:Protein of unknown function [Gryllus bimaculatus]|nr:Protein of unknown function [Gryllus bimaculatus]